MTPIAFDRGAMLRRLADEPFDVLVVGGGITGVGVALDAASRGLRTALVEKGDLDAAKRSSAVAGADHVGVHPPHDYGLAVALLNLADRVVPADQVAPLSRGIDGFLLASSLAVTDPPRAIPVFEEMKQYQPTLPEPSRTYMQYVNDRMVDKLGPVLLPIADGLKDHPAMSSLSPERATPPIARNVLFNIDEGLRMFPRAIWGVTATGRDMFRIVTLGLSLGCDLVRVGFEDGIHLPDGSVARDNAELSATTAIGITTSHSSPLVASFTTTLRL